MPLELCAPVWVADCIYGLKWSSRLLGQEGGLGQPLTLQCKTCSYKIKRRMSRTEVISLFLCFLYLRCFELKKQESKKALRWISFVIWRISILWMIKLMAISPWKAPLSAERATLHHLFWFISVSFNLLWHMFSSYNYIMAFLLHQLCSKILPPLLQFSA